MSGSERIPLPIPVGAYLRDHVFAGNAVYPAVEAIGSLARSTLAARPGLAVSRMADAEFTRFLPVPACDVLEAFNDIEPRDDGSVIARLVTVRTSMQSSITRPIEHVRVTFGAA
jgi:hypothetical protein